ncbi:MAG: phospho-sugar mutase, partial [Clostridia bacterium]|nr:phospho-sugar mutase [Clostridia bacterium]
SSLLRNNVFLTLTFLIPKNPNPESEEAYTLSIDKMKQTGADLAIATDPDCDRLGAVIRCKNGDFRLLTGNQSGAVLMYYLLTRLQAKGTLPQNGMMCNTIVTSSLGDAIARSFGLTVEKTLTGFKFIGDKIQTHQEIGDKTFVFGYEESYGCLIGDFVRDKDGVQASLLFCEAADYYKMQEKTLVDVLDEIYKQFGYYYDHLTSLTLKGEAGAKRIQQILTDLRNQPRSTLGGYPIEGFTDFLNPPSGFPQSDVLLYHLPKGGFVAVRPSGTEPKCKFYYCIAADSLAQAKAITLAIRNELEPKE